MEKLFLICNAHIDPVWLWKMDEGLGTAITTFSQAADFLEEYDGFVFNHNESLLYEYIEQVAPSLFERIQKLVARGKWHIMGGWFLQPDAIMPCGESLLRQIIKGREYFLEKFSVFPEIAVNFDSFGHSFGLVQILAKTGYKGFVCCRPAEEIKERMFIWKGYDNTEIKLYRAVDNYSTLMGELKGKLENYAEYFKDYKVQGLFWGVGNHGGGPSRIDLDSIAEFEKSHPDIKIEQSNIEQFFEEYCASDIELPVYNGSIKDVLPGCYTSQHKVKQLHQKLENDLYMTEKMCVHASFYGYFYPQEKLSEAERCLLLCEFHDILPGTSIKEGEEYAIKKLHQGLVILEEIRNFAFIALTNGQKRAEEGEYPIFVYNPHPYTVNKTIVSEFNLVNQNWEDTISVPTVLYEGKEVPSQLEKESANLNLDWRKRVVFQAELRPFTMHRFKCFTKPSTINKAKQEWNFTAKGAKTEVIFSKENCLIDNVSYDGKKLLADKMRISVFDYCGDPWGFEYNKYNTKIGEFRPMNKEELKFFLNDETAYEPIRVVEDGVVRTVVESYLIYNATSLRLLFFINKFDGTVEMEYEINNSEKDKIFRIEVEPAAKGSIIGRICFGVDSIEHNGREHLAQDYLLYKAGEKSFGIIHFGNYGFRSDGKVISSTLAHFPAYAGHPIADRQLLTNHRYTERIDQGITTGKYIFVSGAEGELEGKISYYNSIFKQEVDALNFFPIKTDGDVKPLFICDNICVEISACFYKGSSLYVRLFNNLGEATECNISSELLGVCEKIQLNAYEFATFKIEKDKLVAVDLSKRENY